MTNYEYYKSELEKFAKLNIRFALDKKTRNIICCAGVQCPQCEFYGDKKIGHICDDTKLKWADAEYVGVTEPEVDWSKVIVDTKFWVRNTEHDKWEPKYFEKYEDGVVYAWAGGATSFSAEHKDRIPWNYVKLASEN